MENNMPMIITKVLEITILIDTNESTSGGIYIPHVAKIDICHDGSIFIREYVDDVRRNKQDNEIGYGIYHSWEEFKSFDTVIFHPAQMIEDWIKQENIDLKWLWK